MGDAGGIAGFVGCQIEHQRGDLFGLGDASDGLAGDEGLLRRFVIPCRAQTLVQTGAFHRATGSVVTEAQRIAAYESAIATLWQADAAHDIGHLRRVWRMARLIAMDEPSADGEILLAAA